MRIRSDGSSAYHYTCTVSVPYMFYSAMELANKRFSVFSLFILLLGEMIICPETSDERIEVSYGYSVTEIKSLKDDKIEEELPEGERIRVCNEGLAAIRHHKPAIQPAGTESVEGHKKYLVQLMSFSSGIQYPMKILPAFKCPTSPATYIHVKSYDRVKGNVKFLVIAKDTSPIANLKFINSYALRLVKDISEAFLEEIPKEIEPTGPAVPAIDADELSAEQRLQMCHRAVTTISEMRTTFQDNVAADTSKYYALEEERQGDGGQFLTRSIVHAFRCPTDPEIYVHVEREDDDEKTLWAITTETGQDPIFGVLGFLLQSITDAIEVSSDYVSKIYAADQMSDDNFSIESNEPGEGARRELCTKSVLVTLGTKVQLLDSEVEKIKWYEIRVNHRGIMDEVIAPAIKCPTGPSEDVYVSLETHPDVGNLSWVYLKKKEPYKELSPWV